MSESATAEIIQFPSRMVALAAPDPVLAGFLAPSEAQVRLARALADLNTALISQRSAMVAWKSALGDLRTVSQRLGTSLRGYSDTLGRVNDRVGSLRTEAVELEAWADIAMSPKG
jgi:hypothetical protein